MDGLAARRKKKRKKRKKKKENEEEEANASFGSAECSSRLWTGELVARKRDIGCLVR